MNRSQPILVAMAALFLAIPFNSGAAELVYDNSSNDLEFNLDPGTSEVGDEIFLDGTSRWLSEFTFEYWGAADNPLAFAGSVQARIRFYLNDGPAYPDVEGAFLPGTVIYDTGTFAIDPSTRATLAFTDFVTGTVVPLTGPLPDSFTWSVVFGGFADNDAAGVTVYSPPTVGNSFSDYWVNDGTSWTLQTNILAMDFAARFSADLIPEPSAVLLGLCGAALFAWVGTRSSDKEEGRRKKEEDSRPRARPLSLECLIPLRGRGGVATPACKSGSACLNSPGRSEKPPRITRITRIEPRRRGPVSLRTSSCLRGDPGILRIRGLSIEHWGLQKAKC